MTHEHLTPTEAIAYSVNMNENGEGERPGRQNHQAGKRRPGRRGEEKREAIEESLGQQSEAGDVDQAAATILDRLVEERVATTGELEEEARRAILEELNAQTVEQEKTGNEAIARATPQNPIEAIWRNQDADQPVKITGYLGTGPDGREYVSIEGSETGVPLDEINVPSGEEASLTPTAAGAGGVGGEEPPEGPTAAGPGGPENEDNNDQRQPGTGGPDAIDPGEYTDRALSPLIEGLNNQMRDIRTRGKPPIFDLDYIRGQIYRLERLIDEGRVGDIGQANRLLQKLNQFRLESLALTLEERGGRYFTSEEEGAIRTSTEERERIFEEIFVGVDANPGVEFNQALSLEARGKLDNFFTTLSQARIFDGTTDITENPARIADVAEEREKLTREFSGKYEVRRILHNANWSVSEGGGDIREFGSSMATFKSEYIDLIFKDPLVESAMHQFENAFQQIKAENEGQLPYEELAWDYKEQSSGLEKRVWDLMREEMKKGIISSNTPEWKLRRAIILARGFGVVSLRFPEISAQARLPEEGPLVSSTARAKRIYSIYGESLARYLDVLEHFIEKFALGEEDRAMLYFFLTGNKSRFQSKEQLRQALNMRSKLKGKDRRLIDMINIFRTGGGFSYSSWRTFTAMEGMGEPGPATPEAIRRSGIGIRENRVSGDVHDDIIREVREDPKNAGKSPEELDEIVQKIEGEEKDKRIFEKRLSMWKDALKSNPLRVMWEWEARERGLRKRFLQEALGPLSDQEARQVEQDLMLIQENTVMALKRGGITYDDSQPNQEMLNYDVLLSKTPTQEEITRRDRVQRYVARIRGGVRENDFGFFRELLQPLPYEESPFPFIIGMEDIPFSDFNFIKTGGRAFARRINDFASAVEASNELINLIVKIPQTHNIAPLIESLVKIRNAVSNYDKRLAMQIMPYLAEGIIRIYDKEILARLPAGIGTVVSLFKDTSFAQEIFGREAMTWDETDKFNFTRHLMLEELLRKKDVADLRKRVGATYGNVAIDILRTYGQLALLLLLYQFTKVTAESK